jgi:hypothetical protein
MADPIRTAAAALARLNKAPILRGDDLPRTGDLVVLSTKVKLQPNAQGVGGALDALQNRFRAPLAIHFTTSVMGASIGVNIKYRDKPLTQGYVPVWLLGYPRYKANEDWAQWSNTELNQLDADQSYSWYLPSPVIIAPGETLIPAFSNFGQLPTNEYVRISYVGRVLTDEKMPRKMQMPYVSSYLSDSWRANVESNASSDANDLVNALKKTVLIHRITGRLVKMQGEWTTTQIQTGYGELLGSFDVNWLTYIQLADSFGNAIIRDPIPWHLAFDWGTSSILLNQPLPAGGFYTAQISNDPSNNTAFLGGGGGGLESGLVVPTMQAQIAIIGTREEAT